MGLRVLVVDDSLAMRRMLERVLGMTELDIAEIHQATNGQEGLDIIMSRPIDLALVDIHMPVMRGPDMIRKVRATPEVAGLPCVVVSSESSDLRIREMSDLGVAFVCKPFTPESVGTVVGQVLAGSATSAAAPSAPAAKDAQALVVRLGRQVLETMAFAFILDEEEAPPVTRGVAIRSRMDFTGPFAGRITLAMPIEALSEIADSMLGVDGEPVAKQQMLDALGELTNVFGGNLLAEIAHGSGNFELQQPQVDEYIAGPDDPAGETVVSRIFFGDGWVRIALELEGAAQPELLAGTRGS